MIVARASILGMGGPRAARPRKRSAPASHQRRHHHPAPRRRPRTGRGRAGRAVGHRRADELEGEGFPVRRAFAGIGLRALDPFIHMDQMGEVDDAPGEPNRCQGTPWHPASWVRDRDLHDRRVFQHQDSNGGGRLITDGDTQWDDRGSGIVIVAT
jgi:quercetin 2,3-dioxygenase